MFFKSSPIGELIKKMAVGLSLRMQGWHYADEIVRSIPARLSLLKDTRMIQINQKIYAQAWVDR